MKYQDIVTQNLKYHLCPFCEMPLAFILEKSEYFFVSMARAPYTENHLLIIPLRHVVLFNDLSPEEVQDLMQLISKWNQKLHTQHTDVNLLLRDGFLWGSIGKSVDHLHFHLIPDLPIGHEEWSSEDRQYLDEKEYLQKTQQIRKNFDDQVEVGE